MPDLKLTKIACLEMKAIEQILRILYKCDWLTTQLNFTGDSYYEAKIRCVHLAFEPFIRNTTGTALSYGQTTFFSICYVLLTVLGVFGNGLVIFVVVRKVQMRTSPNVLIANLAVCNLLLALIVYPLLWQPDKSGVFPYGRIVCKIATAFPGSNIYCSTLSISLMAVNRYYTVRKRHVFSESRRKVFVALAVALGIWVLSFALSTPLLVFYDTAQLPSVLINVSIGGNRTENFARTFCQLAPSANYDDSDFFKISLLINVAQVSFLYLVPLIILSVFNLKLTLFVWRQRQLRGENSRGTRVSAVARQRNRMAVLLIAMAASYAILWLPYVVVTTLIDFRVLSYERGWLDNSVKLLSMLSICVNPLLYGYFNTNFNSEFKEIFQLLFFFCRRTGHEQSNVFSMINRSHSAPQIANDNLSPRKSYCVAEVCEQEEQPYLRRQLPVMRGRAFSTPNSSRPVDLVLVADSDNQANGLTSL